ncbi:C40 family peptidase [Nocardioides sp. SYSU D00038]|uniref:C40 family peptidase n=1 Tax=Nocardioides sp. SYSU D00038 TaxID=2812554 RepID=UPI001967F5BF|nr:C40 family peptidase [Nocardioides sp. SYSU D00038]
MRSYHPAHPSAHPRSDRSRRTRLGSLAAALVLLVGLPAASLVALAPAASAHRAPLGATSERVVPQGGAADNKNRASRGKRVVRIAASKAGSPYRYGGNGPGVFDCSGFTRWVYARVGRHLPRTSSAQAGAVRRVGKPRLGDLVFFTGGSGVYHVGIYAGGHSIWHAPSTGRSVSRERIWTSSVFYGRP